MAAIHAELDGSFRPRQIYEQVSERIRDEIAAGHFLPESRLPSERDLAALFGVGRPAVREAICAPPNEGLVVTKRNSGTFVCGDAFDRLSRPSASSTETADFSPSSTLDVRMVLEPA